MKQPLLGLVAFMVVSVAHAQGTFNASNNYVPAGASYKAFIFGCDGLLAKANGRVQIINPADGSTLSPNGTAGVPLSLDGLFFINGLSVPGVPTGGTATIVVRAWDVASGATWGDATVRSGAGIGLVTVTSLGGGTTPAATFAANSNFVGLLLGSPIEGCIPEPAPMGLAVLGLVGLLCWPRQR